MTHADRCRRKRPAGKSREDEAKASEIAEQEQLEDTELEMVQISLSHILCKIDQGPEI